jgi:hypothetical protein
MMGCQGRPSISEDHGVFTRPRSVRQKVKSAEKIARWGLTMRPFRNGCKLQIADFKRACLRWHGNQHAEDRFEVLVQVN